METSICEVCLKSSMLCSACRSRAETEKIGEKEIEISRYLYNISKDISSLQTAKITKIIYSDSIIIITAEGDVAKVVGKNGSVVKLLAKNFAKSIKVVDEKKDMKEFINSMIKPLTIAGMNSLYSAGKCEYKIKLVNSKNIKLSMSFDQLSELLEKLYGNKVKFEINR